MNTTCKATSIAEAAHDVSASTHWHMPLLKAPIRKAASTQPKQGAVSQNGTMPFMPVGARVHVMPGRRRWDCHCERTWRSGHAHGATRTDRRYGRHRTPRMNQGRDDPVANLDVEGRQADRRNCVDGLDAIMGGVAARRIHEAKMQPTDSGRVMVADRQRRPPIAPPSATESGHRLRMLFIPSRASHAEGRC